jgi:hypothetical protein
MGNVKFAGVPKFYLLHIVNTNGFMPAPGPVAPLGGYTIRFSPHPTGPVLGNILAASAGNGDFHTTSSDVADKAVVIPLGSINGDARADFIAAVRDDLGDINDFFTRRPDQHTGDLLSRSLARVYFGSGQPGNVTFGTDTVTLALPAPLASASIWEVQSNVANIGDINADGRDATVASVGNAGFNKGQVTALKANLVPVRDYRYAEEIRRRYPLHQYRRAARLMKELRAIKSAKEVDAKIFWTSSEAGGADDVSILEVSEPRGSELIISEVSLLEVSRAGSLSGEDPPGVDVGAISFRL